MVNKKLMEIIKKYTNIEVDTDKNLFGTLYPVDIYCIISDIEKIFSISIHSELFLKHRNINILMLNSIIKESFS